MFQIVDTAARKIAFRKLPFAEATKRVEMLNAAYRTARFRVVDPANGVGLD